MWLFTRYGFYSISAQGDLLAIRARREQHLQNLVERFPLLRRAKILRSDFTDYRFRIMVPKTAWATKILPKLCEEQTWGNFKDEARSFNGESDAYVQILHEVWKIMLGIQKTPEWDITDFEYVPFMNGEPPAEEVFEGMRATGVKPEDLPDEEDRKQYAGWLRAAANKSNL